MRVAFSNLGCKLNQAELEDLARQFAAAGHDVVAAAPEADLHVVNSCTVTHRAARDSRKTARRGRRHNERLRTVLTGCWVESDPEAAAALAGVDLVVPNAAKEQLLERVHAAFPELRPPGLAASPLEVPYVPLAFGNARALVKIEDGCDMRCAFCIIPATRGRQRSRHPAAVVRDVRRLAAAGFAEVVVTGVQISSYRWDDTGLFELVRRLLRETSVPRLRLTSIAPWELDLRLLDLFAADPGGGTRLCRHFHLSLQSGCDATLRRMRRPYTAARFAAVVERVRERLPRAAITTDVIVGFPGESAADFEESLAFVAAQGFARVHAFPYSARPGTAAAGFGGRVEPAVARERMGRLLAVAAAGAAAFARAQLGQTVSVLWEERRGAVWRGTSDNYLRVETRAAAPLRRRLAAARLVAVDGPLLRGTLTPRQAVAGAPPGRGLDCR
ncbi:MAG: tRNA (N(6)-L-threonylcarbamoyladenosine(37)-C(2))-methylthiotransferase MtaB [Acidobacteriota bacterium]|nr:tRNA (N(6)-L-threonylcarbamoyladenosine(37)-C(2))-methylthiotransferase MtaB [Acidobacteriota bacterium]MDH3522497.1 tRNA (N(6)-L-threonylcarbamoyladenosine(37)-C(2))-methylthiotransferase MtaB [Acidobacteriota bacterium]